MKGREELAVCAALALALGWGAWRAGTWALPGMEAQGASMPYAESGEVLLHGFNAGKALQPSFHMPLSSLLAVELFGHAPSGGWPWRAVALTAGLLSVACACILCGAARAAVPAVLILLLFPDLWPRHGSYVQFFYAPLVMLAAAAMAWRARAPTPARTAVFSAALGTTLLFRSPLAFLPPALALLEWAGRRKRGRAANAAVLLTLPYIFLLPWLALNRTLYGEWTLFERGEALPNIVNAALGLVHYSEQAWREQSRALPSQDLLVSLGWAFGEIARHPWRYLAGAVGRLGFVLGLQPWLFAAAAAAAWTRRKNPSARALALFCAYFVLIHCSIAVVKHFMVPLWPALGALAALLLAPARLKAEEPSPRLARAARAWLFLAVGLGCLASTAAAAASLRYARWARWRAPDSREALDQALARAPRDAWLLYQRGWLNLKAGARQEAAADWGEAAALRPDNPLWSLHHAWAEMLAGRPQRLLAWDRPLHPHSLSAELLDADLLLAHAYERAGQAPRAAERLRAARRWIEAREGPGNELLALEMLWNRVEELFGGLPAADWLGLWTRLYRLSDSAAEKAVALRWDPMREAAVRLQGRGQHRQALALLRELLKIREDSAALWTDKAISEAAEGLPAAAAADLRRALALDAAFWPAYLTGAELSLRSGRPQEALRLYDRALAAPGGRRDDPLLELLRSSRAGLIARKSAP